MARQPSLGGKFACIAIWEPRWPNRLFDHECLQRLKTGLPKTRNPESGYGIIKQKQNFVDMKISTKGSHLGNSFYSSWQIMISVRSPVKFSKVCLRLQLLQLGQWCLYSKAVPLGVKLQNTPERPWPIYVYKIEYTESVNQEILSFLSIFLFLCNLPYADWLVSRGFSFFRKS